MRPRRTSPDQQDVVARRLELLSAELAAVRAEAGPVEVAGQPADEPPEDHTQIRPAHVPDPWAPPADVETPGESASTVPPDPPGLPLPGRHASRRGGTALIGAVVPATLRGRVTLSPHHLTLVALAVAVGLAVTTWWVISGHAEGQPIAASTPPVGDLVTLPSGAPDAGSAAADPATAAGDTAAPAGEVVVDVAGKVRRPGIAVLDAGARVVDAIEAAGGARKGVDLAGLNLARPLVDGEQILVGVEPAAGGPAGTTTVPAVPGGVAALVNINTADQTTLETLPGVGPVTAGSILEWRSRHGAFSRVEELAEVNGIGPATLARLLPHVTL